MKIATWNVNSIRMRLPRLRGWLDRRRPDIVCLQETKVEDAHFPFDDLSALGYETLARGEKTYNGVAILSRRPAGDVLTCLPDDEAGAPSRLLAATIDGIRVVNVYGPNGSAVGSEKYAFKLAWYTRLRAFLKTLDPKDPVVLCGDLNIAPDERDVWDPEQWKGQIMFSEPEREIFRGLLGWGFADAFRMKRPDDRLFTWWDYRGGAFHRNMGLRIDHILLTPSLAQRCDAVEIDRDERKGQQPSDHAPVVATLA